MANATGESGSSEDAVPCEPDLDFMSILTNGVFAFFVGTEKKRFDVHISVLKRISEPLGTMMTNGMTRESIEKEAKLPEVDPVTFAMMLEYAYKGTCGISHGETNTNLEITLLPSFYCHVCRNVQEPQYVNGTEYPFCSASCREQHRNRLIQINRQDYTPRRTPPYTAWCVADGGDVVLDDGKSDGTLCSTCIEFGTGRQDFSLEHVETLGKVHATSKCSAAFISKKFGCSTMTHDEIPEHIRRHVDAKGTIRCTDISLHQYAKLYALATQYMVPDLPDICLHKLHARLLTFDINKDSIGELVQLLVYVYKNTSNHGSIMDGTGDKLRDLVIRYVVDRAKDLMQYGDFRYQGLLGAGGAPSADFMAIVYGKATS